MKLFVLNLTIVSVLFFISCSENQPIDYTNSNPYLEITDPKMNANVPDSITIKISTNIKNIVRVELYIDHNLESVFKKPPYKYLWNTMFYKDGSQHILQAVAYDLNGDSINSKFVIVNVFRFSPSNLLAFLKAEGWLSEREEAELCDKLIT